MVIRVCGLQRSGTNYLFSLLKQNLEGTKYELSSHAKHRRLFTYEEFKKQYFTDLKKHRVNPTIEQKGLITAKQHISTMDDFLKHMGAKNGDIFLYTIKAPHHWISSYHYSGLSGGASYWQMIYEYELFLEKLLLVKSQDKNKKIICNSYDYICTYPEDYLKNIAIMLNINIKAVGLKPNTKVPMSLNFDRKENYKKIQDKFIYDRTYKEQREYIKLFLEPLYIETTRYYLNY